MVFLFYLRITLIGEVVKIFPFFKTDLKTGTTHAAIKKSKNLLHFPAVCVIIQITDVKIRNSPVWWNWQTHGT